MNGHSGLNGASVVTLVEKVFKKGLESAKVFFALVRPMITKLAIFWTVQSLVTIH